MTFAFGWYSFKLKSYTIEELHLDKNLWNDSTFEIRQEVFHLFWIPVFSLGKLYRVRKQNKLYEVPDSITSKIKGKGKVRTPWYSFLLPILAVVIPILVFIYIEIGSAFLRNKHYTQEKKWYDTSISEVQSNLKNLSKNAYLQIVNTEKPNNEEIILLKLVEIKGDSYKFTVKKVNHPKDQNEKYSIESRSKDTLVFRRSELQDAICTDYEIIEKRKPFGINFLNEGKSIITKIDYFDKPIITGEADWYFWDTVRRDDFQYTSNYRDNKKEIELIFQNFGIPADLVEIKNIENNVLWDNQFPLHFGTYQYLKDIPVKGLTTENPDKMKFKSLFIFKDSLNNIHKFEVQGENRFFTVKRKN